MDNTRSTTCSLSRDATQDWQVSQQQQQHQLPGGTSNLASLNFAISSTQWRARVFSVAHPGRIHSLTVGIGADSIGTYAIRVALYTVTSVVDAGDGKLGSLTGAVPDAQIAAQDVRVALSRTPALVTLQLDAARFPVPTDVLRALVLSSPSVAPLYLYACQPAAMTIESGVEMAPPPADWMSYSSGAPDSWCGASAAACSWAAPCAVQCSPNKHAKNLAGRNPSTRRYLQHKQAWSPSTWCEHVHSYSGWHPWCTRAAVVHPC